MFTNITQVTGTAHRLHFYPAEAEGEEEAAAWHLGELGRTEAEHLLEHSGNDIGSFLVRRSPRTGQLVLSVKVWGEGAGAGHYHTQHHRLSAAALARLPDTAPAPLTTVCLLPAPTTDWELLRSWEILHQVDNYLEKLIH